MIAWSKSSTDSLASPSVFLTSKTTLHLVFNLPLAKLYVNSLLSTLNARAFAQNSRYTMNTSALRMGGVSNNLRMAESGAMAQSQVSNKGFDPISSNSEVTAVDGRSKGFFKSIGGGKGDSEKNNDVGVHILTIEEQFESNGTDLNAEPLPYVSSKSTRTAGDSRKSSEGSLGESRYDEANARSEGTLALHSQMKTSPASQDNHPYTKY